MLIGSLFRILIHLLEFDAVLCVGGLVGFCADEISQVNLNFDSYWYPIFLKSNCWITKHSALFKKWVNGTKTYLTKIYFYYLKHFSV